MSNATVLTNIGTSWDNLPYFKPIDDNNDYTRSCQGGGTYTIWNLNELIDWIPEEGFKTKEFESTTVEYSPDGQLGRGSFLHLTDLSPGPHSIILQASNYGHLIRKLSSR